MEEYSSFPPIDPTNFDLIIVGTGLAESFIAAAATAAGKSVLHLDANSFYGSLFSTLPLPEIASFLQKSHLPSTPTKCSATNDAAPSDYHTVNLSTRPLISDAEVSPITPDLDHCGRFSLDVSGPRVLFCADSAMSLLIKTGVSEYLEFKSVDRSYMYEASADGGSGLTRVPAFEKEIFKPPSFSRMERLKLGQFLKELKNHLESATIPLQDLESPFVEFLAKQQRLSRFSYM